VRCRPLRRPRDRCASATRPCRPGLRPFSSTRPGSFGSSALTSCGRFFATFLTARSASSSTRCRRGHVAGASSGSMNLASCARPRPTAPCGCARAPARRSVALLGLGGTLLGRLGAFLIRSSSGRPCCSRSSIWELDVGELASRASSPGRRLLGLLVGLLEALVGDALVLGREPSVVALLGGVSTGGRRLCHWCLLLG
jgi:hypothetical protein